MFLTSNQDFLIREFSTADFNQVLKIADNINKQAFIKDAFQPFYAFQVPLTDKNYFLRLEEKTRDFLLKAFIEKETNPRSTYRLALCNKKDEVIGNITIDVLPFKDKDGQIIQGDIGYFINPQDGRHGLMSRAIEHVLNVYFKTHDTLDITIHPNNLYSLKMMQRFNAKIVGFKSLTSYQGEPRLVLKLSKEDYFSRKTPVKIKSQILPIHHDDKGHEKDV